MLNKVCEVFTKEYKKETKFIEFMKDMLYNFKLNDKSEDVEFKIKRLLDKNFVSEFKVRMK